MARDVLLMNQYSFLYISMPLVQVGDRSKFQRSDSCEKNKEESLKARGCDIGFEGD